MLSAVQREDTLDCLNSRRPVRRPGKGQSASSDRDGDGVGQPVAKSRQTPAHILGPDRDGSGAQGSGCDRWRGRADSPPRRIARAFGWRGSHRKGTMRRAPTRGMG